MTEVPLNAACPCGSGKTYLRCCGHLDHRIWGEYALGRMDGKLTDERWAHVVAAEPRCEYAGDAMPPGILVRQLGDSYPWRAIADAVCGRQEARAALTKSGSGETQKTAWRETEIVDPGDRAEDVLQLVRNLYLHEAQPFYGRQLRSLESPHILRYSPGSYYRPHADSDQLNPDTRRWEKTLDRDISLLLYLDEDFSGGEVKFPNFDFQIRPRAGMLLMFPSDCRYLHGVLPVTRGIRHTVVSWCALQPA